MDPDAKDITDMMSGQGASVAKRGKSPKLVWVVLLCVVLGVALGIVVYQQSVKSRMAVRTSPKPTASRLPTASKLPEVSPKIGVSPAASASAKPAGINAVEDWEYNDYEDDSNDPMLALAPSPSVKKVTSPSPSLQASKSPSPKSSASVAPSKSPVASKSPSPSPRAAMPDTSGGVPETGVFEITVGTVSVGLILLVVGLVGLLIL